jgi:hypothetical protein
MAKTCNIAYRMNLRLFEWHLEFSSESGNHYRVVRCPAFKLKVNILSTIFNLQEAITQKPCFSWTFFLVLWCRFTCSRFGRAFVVHPFYNIVVCCILLLKNKSPISDHSLLGCDAEWFGSWVRPFHSACTSSKNERWKEYLIEGGWVGVYFWM